MEKSRRHSRLILLLVVTVAITAVALNRDKLDPALLDAWLDGLGILAPLAYIALYAIGTVLFAPGSLFALAGGAMFGPVWGTLLNLTGATIGAGIAFLVARYLAGDWVSKKTGGRLKRMIQGVEAEGWRFVAFVRLVPLFPFNLTNYALGLTRIPFLSYVVTSFVTMAPGALAYTWLGHAGREAIGGNSSSIRYGLLALGLLAAIALLPRLIKRIRGDETPWLEAEELLTRLQNGERVLVLDVRKPEEFTGEHGHIAGALNVPLEELADRLADVREKTADAIIAVCRTDRRSAAAEIQLRDAGFENLSVLRGGMVRWNELGYEVH
ncbi:MAG: sulfurtransferase [Erythrobacter sp.]|nr:sulfurtransferase [Erythrobacter sp.]|tara:strand:+ start:646 stop:1620 length:975 start_codon:yes stop_codon:yes gene_type:complete